MGDYAAAAETFRERIQLSPRTDLSRSFLAAALGHLGQADAAQQVWQELMEINPNYSSEAHIGRLPFANPADQQCFIAGLGKAGLPPT